MDMTEITEALEKIRAWPFFLAVLLTVTPCAAQSPADDADAIKLLIGNAKIMGYCKAIEYDVDMRRSIEIADDASSRLLTAGFSQALVDGIVTHAQSDAGSLDFVIAGDKAFREGDPVGSLARMEAAYLSLQTRCDIIADNPNFSGVVTRSGYQATQGPKSFYAMTVYDADHGDVKKMQLLGDLYSGDAIADPKHVQELAWYKKAVEAGSGHAAAMLVVNYFTGRGVQKDFAEAEKWALISETLGDGDVETREIIESKMTKVQKNEGWRRAQDWLVDHK